MNSSSVFLLLLLLASSSASAFNITRMLDQYPDFSNFNSLLTQTHLASEINSRQTITVLVVDNGAVSGLYSSPADVQKHVLSVHVVLDYYDMEKLKQSSKKSTLLTTLFQSSGLATNQQGFINVTIDKSSGEISMGSAVPGSTLDARVVKQVASSPYNISVLQVSTLIRPAGIDDANASKAPVPSPKAASPAPAAAPSGASSPSPVADGPAADAESPVPEAPASSQAPADSPAADGPEAYSPPLSARFGSSSPIAEGPTPDHSSTTATRVVLVSCLGLIVGVVCMAFL
ncbi:hypothetical protein ACLOJK_030665 [Asimina triloba]